MKKPISNKVVAPAWAAVLAAGLAILAAGPQASAQTRPEREALPNFDMRTTAPATAAESARRAQGEARLKQMLPAAEVNFDALLGAPKFVRSRTGFLTGPSGQGLAVSSLTSQAVPAADPFRAVRGFLDEHATLFGHGAEALNGAKITRDHTGDRNGLRTVVWQQQLDGIPVFESVLIGNLTKRGELVSLASRFLPDLAQSADAGMPNRAALQLQPAVSAEQAIVKAAQNLGDTLASGDVISSGTEKEGDGYSCYRVGTTPVHARLVWLPLQRGALRLSWEVFLVRKASYEKYQVLVDAETGEAQVRRGLTWHISDATYNVYTGESPSPFAPGWPTPNAGQPPLVSRQMVTLSAMDTTASPDGWIADADNETRGNNADTFLDRDFDSQPDGGARPQGNPPRVFDFALDLTQDPVTYTNAAVVQMFYWLNWYHDRLYQLGFTESAGNYQENNFGRGGVGGDSIIGYVQAGADVGYANNAFFMGAPDGINGQIAMFTWSFPTPDRDGDLDAGVIFHEATHGTSMRQVGGGVGMYTHVTRGLGEGWSDFYALALANEPGDDPNGSYPMGGYVTYLLGGLNQNYYFGIRRYPYSTDMTKDPFTFKDIDPTQIVPHTGVPRNPIDGPFDPSEANDIYLMGQLWATMLWEVRANLIAKHGYDVGSELTLQLVTEGMRLSPANPNFIEARDAIILADLVNNAGANAGEIWAGFAKRGLGFSASAPDSTSNIGVVEAFDAPGLNVQATRISGGNGNGVIDVNECNNLEIILANFNDFPITGLSVQLSTITPGVGFGVRSSDYLDILPLGLGTNLVPFTLSTAPYFVCGTPITLNVLLKSDQDTRTNTIVLNTGTVGLPIRFDSVQPVRVPDNSAAGTNSPIVVSNILSSLREVSVSLYITHTWDADLRLELVAPDGTTAILSDAHGGSGDNYGAACVPESLRTIFDDDGPLPIANGVPPFIGTFRPDEALTTFVGKSGTNVNGTWNLHLVDEAGGDAGTLHCWSLFLSPAACEDGGGSCPGADLAIGMADVPDPVFVGSNLVYTIVVTNYGPSGAKTVVVNQQLPAGTVFVSAIASQGSTVNAGNAVIWNLGNLPFAATATMAVTVTPTTVGSLTSSANVSSSDADGDLSNNNVTVATRVNPPTADLAISLADTPDPALVGGLLTYTATVFNQGPSTASGVVVTNVLPLNVVVQSATTAQGFANIFGNVVVFSFGSMAAGTQASGTIAVTPLVQGTIVASATVRANQIDPVTANNSTLTSTVIGPAADLVVSVTDSPDPVVIRSNLTYRIAVTNLGPSSASGVLLNSTLPTTVTVLSTNTTQGTVSVSGSTVLGNLGSLASGAGAVVTVTVRPAAGGTITANALVTSGESDTDTTNNFAAISTVVAPPFVAVQPAGAMLTDESNVPANGFVEIGETVTVQLRLRNTGNVSNTNLTATLLASGGVTPITTTQMYGILSPGGLPVGRWFTLAAAGTNGGTVTATLKLQDGPNDLGTVSFDFALPNLHTFANTNPIVVADFGPATPYPSSIVVSGLTGIVGKVTVTLSNANHTYPPDLDVLLVGPGGQKVVLMSDAGGNEVMQSTTITFDESAAIVLPQAAAVVSGSYGPADYEPGDMFADPAPTGPYGGNLSSFGGANPNGTWSLYVMDDSAGDAGNITGGWQVAISTVKPVNQIADLELKGQATPSSSQVGESLTYLFTVTNAGPNAASGVAFTNWVPAGASLLSVTASQGSASAIGNLVFGSLGNLAVGATASVTVVVSPLAAGMLTNAAAVAASDVDLNPGNNGASVVTAVGLPAADVALAQSAVPAMTTIGSNVTFTLSLTNRGPERALQVVVTDPLPAFLSVVSATSDTGTVTNSAGTIIANLGALAPDGGATITIVATATSLGAWTNVAVATTQSGDPVAANNSATAIGAVLAPVASLSPAGAALVAEESIPPNGIIENGETVTVSLALRNLGSADTANLVAALEASGGVTPSSGPQTYGVVSQNGMIASQPFTFKASGAEGDVVVATLRLQDGTTDLGTAAFTFYLPGTRTFANTAGITIPNRGPASPYPSTITVSGVLGVVGKLTVTLEGFTHGFPDDLDLLLVGPAGQKVLLMSDTGGGHAVTNLTLTLDDAATNALPDSVTLTSGTFQSADYDAGDAFPAPAPAGVSVGGLAAFNGTDPNGTWSLFVVDDSTGDAGRFSGGWSLNLTSVSPVNPSADLAVSVTDAPDPAYDGDTVTYTVVVVNNGPATVTGIALTNLLPAGMSYVSGSTSQGTLAVAGDRVTGSLGSLAPSGTVTILLRGTFATGGPFVNSVAVAGWESDMNPANNSAQATTTVKVAAPARLADATWTEGKIQGNLLGEPGLTYVIQGSTNLTSWLPVVTNTTSVNGVFKFADENASQYGQRYYRAVRQMP